MKLLSTFAVASVFALNAQSADVYQRNEAIGRGINLGNALEAPSEGSWGVVLKDHYFTKISKAGFDSVRIPIRWSNHAAPNKPYTINETFFKRVDWAINQALKNDLVVIIDIHHYEEILKDPLQHKSRFLAMWKQIAKRYKDYPNQLYFEILNEPNGQLKPALWNEFSNEAIRIIRKTNPNRTLIVGGANWNTIKQLENLKLPENDRNIIATFHHYAPFSFTHQGAEWIGSESHSWLGNKWMGTESEKQKMRNYFDQAAAWSEANDRPLYMGEFGVYGKADMDSRARWTAFICEEAERNNISWAYWEFCSGFGAYNPHSETWYPQLLKALIPSEK